MQCTICQEDDETVLIACRDGRVYCAHHANEAGHCWGCGEADPQWYGEEFNDGLCHDCRSADVMFERRHKRVIKQRVSLQAGLEETQEGPIMHSTAAILSVITGVALAPIGEIQDLLSFMTGDDIYTHQIPRALHACAPAVCEQFPAWAHVEVPATVRGWNAVHDWLTQFPQESHHVTPLATWQRRDPAAELAEMVGDVRRVIVVGDNKRN